MATADAPSISHYVNDAGAYVVSISAIPDEHLHDPLIVHVGDHTVLGRVDRRPPRSPTYPRYEGHDPECALAPGTRLSPRPADGA